ncbi:MAG: DUF6159 family protein [Nanoarchaeota archaeon]|mgnify:CR=1 FL=1
MGKIATGWKITKQSFEVIKHDKEILIYPILATISIIVVIGILTVLSFLGILGVTLISSNLSYFSALVLLAIITICAYFISVFFQAAIVTSATIRFSGRNPTLADGLRGPSKRIFSLFGWAAISALVGTILAALKRSGSNRSKTVAIGSQIGAGLLGTAWNLITFFTIPIILFEKYGPIQSIKHSTHLFKKTWGENVTAQFSIGAIFFLISLPFIVLMILAIMSKNISFIIASAIILVIAIIMIMVVSTSVNGILKAALYQYAKTGKMPKVYDNHTIEKMFVKR